MALILHVAAQLYSAGVAILSLKAIIIAPMIFTSANVLATVPEVYSENSALSREQVYSSSTRLRMPVYDLGPITAFAQAGNELIEGRTNAVDTASHDYVGAGVLRRIQAVTLWAESRNRHFYGPESEFQAESPVWDHRVGAATGYESQLHSSAGLFDQWFTESYAESVFTSADANNVIAAGYSRLGVQWTYAHHPLLSVYAEPYLDLDRVGHFYNNQYGVKGSLRIQTQLNSSVSNLNASLAVSRLAMTYVGRHSSEVNPISHEHYGFALLGVLGTWI